MSELKNKDVKKCKLKNNYNKDVKVVWCHHPPGTVSNLCYEIGPGMDGEAPEISDAAGYLTLQAQKKNSKPVESKITLSPPFDNEHCIILSYVNKTWTINAKKVPLIKQVGVNVEIGPR
jgi:hypothetical protein